MPQNKKHHYVPRFLLKRFSRDGKSIALYNIPSKTLVPRAPLKTQCYSDYLYGKDSAIEKMLAGVEGELATILRVMDTVLVPPPRLTEVHDALLFFVLSQKGRTQYAADALDEMFDGMMKNIFGKMFKDRHGIDLNQYNISFKEPALLAMSTQICAYPLLWDLEFKLLVNKTNEEFVISDNPVVFYNQLMSFRRFASNCGLAFKGLQIFVPLDPRKMLIFYDQDVYRVGSDSKGVIDISNPRDVYELNTLQFVSARENIYFSDPAFDAAGLTKKATPFLRTRKGQVSSFNSDDGTGMAKYVGTSAEDVRTNLQLSFVTLRGTAKKWLAEERRKKFGPLLIVRNKKLTTSFEAFMEEVQKGTYKATQFKDFIRAQLDAELSGGRQTG